MTAAAATHTYQRPTVTPTAHDPWAHDPDRTTRHQVASVAPPVKS